MKIERVITKYNNTDDSFEGEFNIDSIPFEELAGIFSPQKDDPLMYDPYEINVVQAELINRRLPSSFPFEFSEYSYFVEAYSAEERFKSFEVLSLMPRVKPAPMRISQYIRVM